LTDEAEKARDYLMKLPARMARISEKESLFLKKRIFLNGLNQQDCKFLKRNK
jgi:hypothetical protein